LVLQEDQLSWYVFAHRASQPFAKGSLEEMKTTVDPNHAAWLLWMSRRCDFDLKMTPNTPQDMSTITVEDIRPVSAGVPSELVGSLKVILTGLYRAKPRCGAPHDTLFVRESPGDRMFFFRNVGRATSPTDDKFVFARDFDQPEIYQYQDVTLSTELLEISGLGSRTRAFTVGYWQPCDRLEARFDSSKNANTGKRGDEATVARSVHDSCAKDVTKAILSFAAHLELPPFPKSAQGRWSDGDPNNEGWSTVAPPQLESFLAQIGPLTPKVWGYMRNLYETSSHGLEVKFCKACCLESPKVHWVTVGAGAAEPMEDPIEAEEFHRDTTDLLPPF